MSGVCHLSVLSRLYRALGALVFGFLLAGQCVAQNFPSKPLKIITTTPGGIIDIVARQLADKLAPALGKPVIVENKANAVIAMQAVAKSLADGHSVAVASFAMLTVVPHMYEQSPYDPLKDFAPVILLYTAPLLFTAHPSLPVNSVPELIRLAKEQPGKLTYSSSGNGQPPHVYMELFKYRAGIDLLHVPYKGTAAALTGLIAGDVNLNMESASAVITHVKSGRIKALAVTGDKRMSSLPEVPTFAEAGVQGISESWVGIVAPAGTPRDIVLRLNQAFANALESQDIKTNYEAAGRSIVANSPEAFSAVIRDDVSKWGQVVSRIGMTPG